MSLRRRLAPGLAAVLLAAGLGSAPAVRGAPLSSVLSLNPSRATGIGVVGQQVGPFTLRNGTDQTFQSQALPVLIRQGRDGGLLVREDAASFAEARRMLAVQATPASLPPGGTYSAGARVTHLTRDHNLYGGVLFKSVPRAAGTGTEIKQVLQLNAALFLDPPRPLQRPRLGAEAIRAEQAGRRRVRFLVPVRNAGNVTLKGSGALRIANSSGAVVARLRLHSSLGVILPGATVELPATLTKVLAAGRYTLAAPVSGRGRRITAWGAVTFFGPNQLAVREAKLLSLPQPTAYFGEPVDVKATFRNTGNLSYRPEAIVELRRSGTGGIGPILLHAALKADKTRPGTKGDVHGSIKLPTRDAYEVTVRLLDGQRVLDERSVSVVQRAAPSLVDRILDWISAHPLATLALFAAMLVAVAAGTARHVRRRLTASSGSPPAGGS